VTEYIPKGNDMPTLIIYGEPPEEIQINKGSISIGRGPENAVALKDMSVSKRHALITYQILPNGSTRMQVADLHSTNGTYVNGKKVSYSPLSDGDQLMFGSVAGAFYTKSPVT
jgi:pSer/pThr/pTyr-binding forkhead associated (FHA) protein